ncbi:MAG: AAA family ATPase [Ruminococcus callidus]|nr:AAA family ATPase [Ruminococcus callidus]
MPFDAVREGGLFMNDTIVRIERIEIKNFKNVGYGHLDFENAKKAGKASILGLYGQNGSGKTALIDALELLRCSLTGRTVPAYFADYINVDSEYATIKYGFKVSSTQANCVYSVCYEVSLRRDLDHTEHNTEQPSGEESYKAVLFDEVLSYSYECGDKKIRLSPVIDTRTDGNFAFLPVTKYQTIVGKNKEISTSLLVAKQLARATSRSFVFSRELLNVIRQNCKEDYHRFLVESLVFFGNFQLFVITTTNAGLISMKALPLAFNYAEKGKASIGNILIKLNEPSLIPESALNVVHKVIDCMNVVLQQLIPGLTISVMDMGAELYPNGKPGYRIQLMSNKNSKEIPLQYESDGIKKLISILQLLIVIYNKPSMTVVIDELDSGVFEYLLGEILRILAEKGKGQLVFTSHNLRPLETLDKGFIAFTTTNPQNRYIRMINVKTTHNLRDFYYRDIVLGEQNEPVYEMTNNSEIAMAFREAGNPDAS